MKGKVSSPGLTALLLVVAALCLFVHFKIYHRTSASAFINRPEFYYNRFVIRDGSGQSIKEVSLTVGFYSYLTALVSVGALCWGVTRIALVRRKGVPSLAE